MQSSSLMSLTANNERDSEFRDLNFLGYQQYTQSIAEKTLTPNEDDPLAGIIRNRDLFLKAQENGKRDG